MYIGTIYTLFIHKLYTHGCMRLPRVYTFNTFEGIKITVSNAILIYTHFIVLNHSREHYLLRISHNREYYDI